MSIWRSSSRRMIQAAASCRNLAQPVITGYESITLAEPRGYQFNP